MDVTPQPPVGPPPGYGYPPPGWVPSPPTGTNVLAILSLVFAFVFAPAGLVLGILGARETRRTGQSGYGLALAGAIVGGILSTILLVYLAFIAFILLVFATGG